MNRFLLAWWVLLGVLAGGERVARAQGISGYTATCSNPTPDPDCCPCGPGCSNAGSLLSSVNMAWIGDGVDYTTADSDKGCTSCGGAMPKVGELPALEVHRYHRYRDLGYWGSLGSGSFTNFDITLSLYQTQDDLLNGKGMVTLLDPRDTGTRQLRNNGQGLYLDGSTGSIQGLTLLDAASQIVQDQAAAVRALLITHEGEQYTFEIMRTSTSPTTTSRFGRLVKQADRNGNALTLAYQFAPDASDAALGFDRRNLWKLSTVTDAYGRQATFTYARVRTWGPWAVSRIDLPNGQHLKYTYNNASLAGVSGVVHPDGTTTTLSTTPDAATQTTVLHYFDAAAEATHRRKSVYLTNPSWVDPVTQQVFTQSANLARQLVNGAGEVSYQITAKYDPAVNQVAHWVYDGGLSFHRFTTDPWGGPASLAHALNGSLAQDPATFTYQPVTSYQISSARRTLGKTDILGRKTAFDPDLATGAVKKTTFPDGTWSTSTYNPFKQPLVEVDRIGRTTQYVYDAQGNKLSKTVAVGQPEQATWSWTYNARGQIATATDANGNVTSYAYTPEGYLASMTEPPDAPGGPQAVTSYVHDAAGRLLSTTDPRGRVTTYARDARNRVTAITYNDASVEHYVYGTGPDANLLVQKIDRLGNVEAHAYDGQGRETQRIQAFGKPEAATRSCTFLEGTNLEKDCTDRGERTVHTYDGYNRRIATTVQPNTATPLTDATVYDEVRRVDHTVDRYGRKTFNVYDINDRVTRTVRETVPGAVTLPLAPGAPGYLAARDTHLKGLARILTPNAQYVIEETQYDAQGQVVARINGRGVSTTHAYDGQGRLIQQIEAAGTPEAGKTERDYDPQGNVILTRHPRHFTEPGGFVTEYTYTGRNLLASMTAALGRPEQATESYGYDLDRKRSLRVDGRGFGWNTLWSFCCGYHQAEIDPEADVDGDPQTPPTRALTVENRDSLGNMTHAWVAGDTSLFPDEASLADPVNTVREMTTRYDGRYRPIARTVWMVELGAVSENAPPIAGDPGYPANMGLTTRWAYDDNLTDGVGLDVVYAGALAGLGLGAGSDGMAVEETNPAGEKRVTIQDGLGRVIRTIDGVGNLTTKTYDTLVSGAPGVPGNVVETATIDGLGHVTLARVDGAGRTLTTLDALGHATVATYDAGNNPLSVFDPNAVGHDAVYDARNRQISRTDTAGDSTGRGYDAGGNVVAMIDGLGNATTYAFDARNQKVAATDRLGGITTFGYDENGNLLQIVDAEGSATNYTYEERNLLVAEAFPPGQQTGANGGPNSDVRVYTYDAGRRLLTRTDQAGVITSYAYDRANRLLVRAYPDGLNDTFAYDPASRLTVADSDRYAVQVDRTYDPAGRLLSDTQTIDGTAYIVSHVYDADNRVVQITYPDGSVVDRGYTDRNELASVTLDGQAVALRAYDAGGLLSTTTLGNGLVETRTYVPGDRLVQTIQVPGVTSFDYTYDANKRKLTETDGILSANGQGFGYDNENRLTTWARTDGVTANDTQSWNLSLVGDWNATTRNGAVENRAHTPVHEVTSVGAMPLSYDSKGNLTVDELGQSYTWDVENRLATAIVPATATEVGKVAAYRYDALGRRVEKTVNGDATRFIHDGAQVVVEYDVPAAEQRVYVYGSYVDDVLAMVVGTNKYYVRSNHLYSPAAITDASGGVVERYRYDAYGRRTVLNAAGTTSLAASSIEFQRGFTGYQLDAETGLYYARARMYSAGLGRFILRDPWRRGWKPRAFDGFPNGMNPYQSYFVPNGMDPSGMLECCSRVGIYWITNGFDSYESCVENVQRGWQIGSVVIDFVAGMGGAFVGESAATSLGAQLTANAAANAASLASGGAAVPVVTTATSATAAVSLAGTSVSIAAAAITGWDLGSRIRALWKCRSKTCEEYASPIWVTKKTLCFDTSGYECPSGSTPW